VVKTIAQYAPNLPQSILRHQIITPKDLEQTYGLSGGHIFHGELALDQFFTMRPLLDWARYTTPIEHLYLCGSGTHPGTGLTGGSGANAARRDRKNAEEVAPPSRRPEMHNARGRRVMHNSAILLVSCPDRKGSSPRLPISSFATTATSCSTTSTETRNRIFFLRGRVRRGEFCF
jgi:hypothetical protein